jgi:hypothetical protein
MGSTVEEHHSSRSRARPTFQDTKMVGPKAPRSFHETFSAWKLLPGYLCSMINHPIRSALDAAFSAVTLN